MSSVRNILKEIAPAFEKLSLSELTNKETLLKAIEQEIIERRIREKVKFGVPGKFPVDLVKVSIATMLPLADHSALLQTSRFFSTSLGVVLAKQKEAIKKSIEKEVDDLIDRMDNNYSNNLGIYSFEIRDLIEKTFNLKNYNTPCALPRFLLSKDWQWSKDLTQKNAHTICFPFYIVREKSGQYRIEFNNYGELTNWRKYPAADPKINTMDWGFERNSISYNLKDFLKIAICTVKQLIPEEPSEDLTLKRKIT